MSEFNIERFIEAQNGAISVYAQALGEIKNGRKTGHWIWYVFPQMRGLVLERFFTGRRCGKTLSLLAQNKG